MPVIRRVHAGDTPCASCDPPVICLKLHTPDTSLLHGGVWWVTRRGLISTPDTRPRTPYTRLHAFYTPFTRLSRLQSGSGEGLAAVLTPWRTHAAGGACLAAGRRAGTGWAGAARPPSSSLPLAVESSR